LHNVLGDKYILFEFFLILIVVFKKMSHPIPEKSNLVSIGAWNPAILQPNWLRSEFPKIITEDSVGVQVVAGAIYSFRMEFKNFFLDPNGGRLVFIPKDLENHTLELISNLAQGIHEKLKHTPISAAGCNFSFKLERDEKFTIDDLEQEDKVKGLYNCFDHDCSLVERGIRHTFAAPDYRININYDYPDEGKIIRINFDYRTPFTPNPMKTAAEKFVENFSKAERIKESLVRKT
jgi:hypothetical protein